MIIDITNIGTLNVFCNSKTLIAYCIKNLFYFDNLRNRDFIKESRVIGYNITKNHDGGSNWKRPSNNSVNFSQTVNENWKKPKISWLAIIYISKRLLIQVIATCYRENLSYRKIECKLILLKFRKILNWSPYILLVNKYLNW